MSGTEKAESWVDAQLARNFEALWKFAALFPGHLPCVIDVSTTRPSGPLDFLAPILGDFQDTAVPGVKRGALVVDDEIREWLRERGFDFEPVAGCFHVLALGPTGPALVLLGFPDDAAKLVALSARGLASNVVAA